MLTWFEDTKSVADPSANPTYAGGLGRILRRDPGGEDAVLGLLTGWLDAVYEGDRSVTSITFDAGHDWHGTPLQVVYDALGDEQLASWWVGLTLIKAAVLHPHAFYAYRPPAFTDVGLRGLTYWPDWARAR